MATPTRAARFRMRVAGILTAAYLVFVLCVTLYPTPVDRGLDSYLDAVLRRLHAHGVPSFVDYDFVEFTSNIAFFVPLGFLAAFFLPYRRWWIAVAGAAVLSSLVETTQGLFLPGRFADVTDVIGNTSGALIGALLAYGWRVVVHVRDRFVVQDAIDLRGGSALVSGEAGD